MQLQTRFEYLQMQNITGLLFVSGAANNSIWFWFARPSYKTDKEVQQWRFVWFVSTTAGVQSLCQRFHPESQGSSRRWLFPWARQATNAASQSSSCWRHICEQLCLRIGWLRNSEYRTTQIFWSLQAKSYGNFCAEKGAYGSYRREKVKLKYFSRTMWV